MTVVPSFEALSISVSFLFLAPIQIDLFCVSQKRLTRQRLKSTLRSISRRLEANRSSSVDHFLVYPLGRVKFFFCTWLEWAKPFPPPKKKPRIMAPSGADVSTHEMSSSLSFSSPTAFLLARDVSLTTDQGVLMTHLVVWLLTFLSALFFGLRLGAKCYRRAGLAVDDALLAAAWVSAHTYYLHGTCLKDHPRPFS